MKKLFKWIQISAGVFELSIAAVIGAAIAYATKTTLTIWICSVVGIVSLIATVSLLCIAFHVDTKDEDERTTDEDEVTGTEFKT